MNPIGKRAQKAALLQFVVRAILIFTTLGQQLIVARIVDPSVYGVIGLVMLTIGFLTVFSETGVAGSIILQESIGREELNLAWTLQVVRGVILSAIVFAVAPLAARFFSEPSLVELLRFAAIAPLLTGLTSPKLLQFRRDLAYGRISAMQLGRTVVNVGLTIPLAIAWENAWALIVPYVIVSGWATLLSFILAPYKPRLFFDRNMANQFSQFGRWAFVNSILHYAINQADTFVVGRLLNSTSVGLYSMAYRVGDMPFSELGMIISDVAFPAFRQAKERIQDAFVRVFATAFLVTAPAAIGLGLVAPEVIRLVLGSGWTGAIVPLQILCGWAFFRSFSVTTGPLFNALGRPEVQTRVAAINVVLLLITLIPFTMVWEITGTSLALLVSAIAMVPISLGFANAMINYQWKRLLKSITHPCIGVALMTLCIELQSAFAPMSSDFTTLVVNVLLGAVCYALWITIAKRYFGYSWADQAFNQIIAFIQKRKKMGA